MKAYWTEKNQRQIGSAAELDSVIDDVRALGEPTILFVEQDDGTTLALGLGAPESVLAYVDTSGASYHSVGDLERGGILRFWCRDQLDDFLAEMAVPVAVATEAAHEFCTNGGIKPSNLRWEADW
ncbi:MAG: Imm1 family immunity protein [Byssovorax sp.]